MKWPRGRVGIAPPKCKRTVVRAVPIRYNRGTEADDTAYALSSDFAQVTGAIKGGATFPGETWCERVAAWQVVPSGAGQGTRLLGYSMTREDAVGTSTFKSAVCLRAE